MDLVRVDDPRPDQFVSSQCERGREMEDSVVVGAPELIPANSGGAGDDATAPEVRLQVVENSDGKRKRGRPPRGQGKTAAAPKKMKDEEDVCFICFDGGKLVLCDRRGCPKAYHPACIKRDEAFFRSKAQWNCGWHICSICEKAAHYMCYTCTYSLCKLCISEADFFCVRGTKGLCTTCMRTVMLIEKNVQGDKETVHVDFDDKSSWEYLFKVYWIYLKGKLSLSSDELTNAKHPWKGAGVLPCKGGSLGVPYGASNNSSTKRNIVGNTSKRKMEKLPNFPNKEDAQNVVEAAVDRRTSLREGVQWASKELLEFVAHMKGGDTSILSQYDVQALLLEYIKGNNLRDPRVKSQIICDMRLGKLFGKARVRHSEMLKLLEFHFLIKEVSRVDCTQQGLVDVITNQAVANGSQPTSSGDKRRKTHRIGDNRRQQTNLDEYAAIDVHNVNLIYLRRSLVEILMEDPGKFSEKVVGAVVRIRTFTVDQKQDMYKLVQVIGTSKAAVPYKVGQKIADVMLEILNIDKREAISIDAISNQEFSEGECWSLYQSIKCGQAKHLTVGEIQEKAMALRDVKLTDCLQSEILRLSQLHDRASEKRRRNELRESVKKLELLNTPEERQRRLREIPEVHSDPSMDLSYRSEENARESDGKEDLFSSSRISSKGSESISPSGGSDVSNSIRAVSQNICEPNKDNPHIGGGSDVSNSIRAVSQNICEPNKDNQHIGFVSGPHGRANELSGKQGIDANKSNNWEKSENQTDLSGSTTVGWNKQRELRSGSSPVVALETLASVLSAEIASSVNSVDTDENWHYQDPDGKIQGPFSIVQLGKWGTDGSFPPDLRIWRMSETQDNSVLLTDALHGLYHREQPLLCDNFLQSQEVKVASDDRRSHWEGKGEGMNLTLTDSRENRGPNWDEATTHPNIDGQFSREDEHCSQSSWKISAGLANLKEKHTGSLSRVSDLFGGNDSWSEQPQVHHSFPSPMVSRERCETVLQQGGEGHESEGQDSGHDYENQNSHRSMVSHTHEEMNNERTSSSCHSGQSSGQNWKPPPPGSPFDGWASNSTVAKSSETSEQQQHENNIPNLPSPLPREADMDQKGSIVGDRSPVVSNAPHQDSGPCGSVASNLVGSGVPLPEVAGEWGGYSPNSGKPSVDERDSALASASLLRLSEAAIDHAATPTSDTGHPTHSSTSHAPSDAPNWQVIVSGANEFSSLGEESVSDLLAEVDAMELDGLPSPTSIMNCSGEFPQGSKTDCFSSIEMLSPTVEPGKGDALSSTGNLQLPFKSTMMDESKPQGLSDANLLNFQKKSSIESSTGAELQGEIKPTDVSVNQCETGSGVEPPASTKGWETSGTESADNGLGAKQGNTNSGRGGPHSETADNGLRPAQGNGNSGRGGTVYGNSNVGWGAVSGMAQAANINQRSSATNLGVLGSQPKYPGGGERYSSTRDRANQGRESSFVRSRPSWNRQSSFGSGGSSRPHHKGQRVCKFYESGYCKKGSFCDYLHP